MELATFSDIEFVGIAADRQVVLGAGCREGRRSSDGSSSSSISLPSIGSEVKRHDPSFKASAFDIQEVYAAVPLSPSSFIVDSVPYPRAKDLGISNRDPPDPVPEPESIFVGPQTPSPALPLERYRQDSQRHERVAVSFALGQACNHAAHHDPPPEFNRSFAPSPSTGGGTGMRVDSARRQSGTVDEVVTAQSIAQADEQDYQAMMRDDSLQRWFDSIKDGTGPAPAVAPGQGTNPPPWPRPLLHHGQPGPPGVSTSLGLIEAEKVIEVGEEKDTDETLLAFRRNFKNCRANELRVGERSRMYRPQRKRKSEEAHRRSRSKRPSPAHLSDR